MEDYPQIKHHGAIDGVTGSCHELWIDQANSVLIDCGLFQGAETSGKGAEFDRLAIEFPIDQVKALIATHVHIDHVGRIPYLLAAGFKGPIICSEPSAILLPLVLEDALKIGFTRDKALISRFLKSIDKQIVPLSYGEWHSIATSSAASLKVRLQRAGHILGSAYVECDVSREAQSERVVFSGDLGAPHAPLLPAPKSPHRADTLVIESTYGDRQHEGRRERKLRLKRILGHALKDGGVVMIPAFSIGRTQELLYELEELIYRFRSESASKGLKWDRLPIIVDSPLASRFTKVHQRLQPFWDKEALQKVSHGRHPLSFDQLVTIDSHAEHMRLVRRLKSTHEPCIVLAASGMCSGGRIMNYLKALIENPRNDILFVGYQAQGTPGRDIQRYGSGNGYVMLDGERYDIHAQVHTIGGYSAHADQADLLNFIRRMKKTPKQVRIVHGDDGAKVTLQNKVIELAATEGFVCEVVVPSE